METLVASKTLLGLDQENLLAYDFAIKLDLGANVAYPPLLDVNYPYREQLPRKAIISFEKVDDETIAVYFIKPDKQKEMLGNTLRDTTYQKDGWGRYHDGGHICLSLLGWCLHLRTFLKIKRKSNPIIDEVEDGAQANIADEGVVFALINKVRRDNLEILNIEDVPNELVEYAKLQFFGKELQNTTDYEWKQVFYAMYQVMNTLRKNEGGYVYINLLERMIAYSTELEMSFYG